MSLQEELQQLIEQEPGLAAVRGFLEAHPKADVYLVGGIIRDVLLGRDGRRPDFDFVIRNTPREDVEDWFTRFGRVDLVGRTFGVYRFVPQDREVARTLAPIDLALPRTEEALPENRGGYRDFDVQSDPNLPIEDDLSRRDFTMNAMAYNLRTHDLIDPFDGQKAVERKVVRAVGDPTRRLSEDHTRILRGLRFAAQLGFTIEPETMRSMRELLPHIHNQSDDGQRFIVPRESLGMELSKGFDANPSGFLLLLETAEAFPLLFPEAHACLLQNPHTIDPIAQTQAGENNLVLALLHREVDPDLVTHRLEQLGLTAVDRDLRRRVHADVVVWLIRQFQKRYNARNIESLPAAEFESVFMHPNASIFLRLLDLTNQHDARNTAIQRTERIRKRWDAEKEEKIPALISGHDLIDLGIQPGPEVRTWLSAVRTEQLEGRVMDRPSAITWLKQQRQK